MNEDRPAWQGVALLALVAAAIFASVVGFDWAPIGDRARIVDNPYVNPGHSWAGIAWAFTAIGPEGWTPVAWLSHMLDVSLFGLAPSGHHLTSALLHTLNALLVFAWLREATGAPDRSFVVALLLLVHPLAVEPASWVSARGPLLAASFGFAALWTYSRAAQRGRAPVTPACVACFGLSVASDPMWFTLPVAMLALDAWPLERRELPLERRVREKLPLFGVALVAAALLLWAPSNAAAGLPLGARMAGALHGFVTQVVHSVWPTGLSVLPPHPWRLPAELGERPSIAWLAGALLCIAAIGLVALRRSGSARAGVSFFAITLLPTLGWIDAAEGATQDRAMLVPLVGLAIALVWWLPEWLAERFLLMGEDQRRGIAAGATIAAVGALAALSLAQVETWRSDVSILTRAVSVNAGNVEARVMLGDALWKRGRRGDGVAQVRAALERWPGFAPAHARLGVMYEAEGRVELALRHYQEALRLAPATAPSLVESLERALGRLSASAPPR